MKSTMKSASAIIAVALMIMVAVVPMVGVFTEESDAATTIVPDTTKSITVSGTVMDSDSQKIKDVLVEVANGSYYEYGLTGSDGKYSITVNYSGESISTLVVSIVTDGKYTTITGYTTNPVAGKFTSGGSQTISSVTGNISGIDFMSGYVAITGKLTYANTSVVYDKEVTVTATPTTGDAKTAASNATTGVYTILVPINSGKVTLSAEGFNTKEVTVAKANVTSGTDLANEKTYKISVTFSNVFGNNSITVSTVEDSKITEPVLGTAVNNVYPLTYVLGTEGTTQNVKFADNNGYMWNKTQALGSSNITLTEDAYVTGSIKMSSLAIPGTNTVTADSVVFWKDSVTTGKTGVFTQFADGRYVIALSSIDGLKDAGANKVKFTASVAANTSVTKEMDISISLSGANTGRDITFDKTGYYLISGTVKNGTTGVAGIQLTITTNDAVGLVNEKVTTDSTGKYSFYAESGQTVTIAPVVENSAVYTPTNQQFVAIADKTVDFTMDSKTLTSGAIKDAASTPVALKGVTVKYRIGTTGAFSDATFDDVASTYSVTVPSSVAMSDIYVYFTKAGYTFAATAENPVAMSTSDVQAKEQTLTFEVKDANNQAITNISGITFQVAKYKIHAVNSEINAFDMIGSLSDVTYDAATGKFSFIAEKLDGTADSYGYKTQYGISVKSNTTVYTFATITEFSNALVIKADEQTFTGRVMDAATETAKDLKGMTVAVYESSAASAAKVSADVTTLNDGSFSIVSKAGYVKVTDPNGIYTFTGVETSDLTNPIKANEQTYSGSIKDADEELVKDANITVKVVNADGETVGSIATVGKLGTYEIITAPATGNKIVATDADGLRTFKDVTFESATDTNMPDVVSGQITLSGTVKTGTTPVKDITVTLSIYSETVDPVLVDVDVTDKDGKFSFFADVLEEGTYGVVAADSGIYRFSTTQTSFAGYIASITTKYSIWNGMVKDANNEALAGINVTVYNGNVVDGEYVTDKNGGFSYPNITDGEAITFTAVDPNGVYTFTAGVSNNNIVAKEQTYKVTVDAKFNGSSNVNLSGITINFIDSDSKVVKSVVTDAKGVASAVLEAGTYTYKAVDATTKYGAMTFGDATSSTTITAKETIYAGYYANGDVVSGVVVTYQIFDNGLFKEKGKAVIIDNMYYIATAVSAATSIKVDANADKFYATEKFTSLSTIGKTDLVITDKDGVVDVADSRGVNELYFVYNYQNAQVGDKIFLSAVNAGYLPLETGNSTTVVKCTFNGWYVNGVKVSDELEYTYTVTEECVVYADYKVSSYETQPSQGVDSTVLIIGVAAVIIALIAVVYAVIQKKE